MSAPSDDPVRDDPVLLNYRTTGLRGSRRATIVRWVMLGLAVLIFQAAVVVLPNPTLALREELGGGIAGTPFAPVRDFRSFRDTDEDMRWWYLAKALVYLAIFLLTQWLLLKRRGRFRLDLLGYGPLTKRSAAILGLIAMLVTTGLLATVMDIPNWWWRLTVEARPATQNDQHLLTQHFGVVWVVMALVWLAWGIIFWRYARSKDHYTALSKIMRGLIAGSVLEMFVAAPVHVWMLKKYSDEECYCTRGSYTGVVFGCTAIVWLFGPGVVLLFMRERRRREAIVTATLSTPRGA